MCTGLSIEAVITVSFFSLEKTAKATVGAERYTVNRGHKKLTTTSDEGPLCFVSSHNSDEQQTNSTQQTKS